MSGQDVSARARALVEGGLVVDLHNDLASRVLDDGYDPDVRHEAGVGEGRGHTDVPRLLASGIDAQWLAAFVDARFAEVVPDESFGRAMRGIETIRALVARHPDRLALAMTAADVHAARAAGRVAILIAVEGGHAIEHSLERLREVHAAGARYLTLTWNNGNAWAGSSEGLNGTRTSGLSAFGREIIREMNRLGVIVDVSHVSTRTFEDALDASTAPVIASHSNARARCDHHRNLTDDQLRAIAQSGGVVGLNFYPEFLDPEHATREGPAPLSLVVDHADHIAAVAGVDHLALGTDFDGIGATPAGLDDVTCLPVLVQALLDRGWRDEDVAKVLGGNAMRVMEQVLK